MLALDPTVVDAVWQSFAAYLPERGDTRPSSGLSSASDLGPRLLRGHLVPPGHRVQLGRGRTLGKGSETTLRRRRDEWLAVGAFGASGRRSHQCLRQGDRPRPLRRVGRRVTAQGAHGRRGDRAEPDRPGQDRMEVVGGHRHQRRAHRLGHRRGQPQRLHPARTDARRRRAAWSARSTSRRCGSTGATTPTSPAPASSNAVSPTP